MKMLELGGRGRGRRRNKPAESRFVTGPVTLGLYLWVVFSVSHEPGGAYLFIIVRVPLIYTVVYTFLYIGRNPPF